MQVIIYKFADGTTNLIKITDLETAQIISDMYGKDIVGNETLSKQLSFVTDAAKEIE
ncbi:MAG: hypothetical protein HFH71_02755 [Clostridia bacterium]|nr:hypothetical protein [Clostridia bacterium]